MPNIVNMDRNRAVGPYLKADPNPLAPQSIPVRSNRTVIAQ